MVRWIVLICLSLSLYAEEGLKKVVFDLTSGDQKTFEQRIFSGIAAHNEYYHSQLQELEVAVVIHGDAYKFFLKDVSKSLYKGDSALISKRSTTEKRLRSLITNYKVKFYMCEVGMKHRQISKDDIYEFVTPVASATIGLIDRQSEGYVYIPIR